MIHLVSLQLREKEAEIELGKINDSEPDVGIFGAWCDEWTATIDGKIVDDLTEQECGQIQKVVDEYVDGLGGDDYDY